MVNNFFGDFLAMFSQGIFYILKAFLPLIFGLIISYILYGPVEFVNGKLNKNSQKTLTAESPKGRTISILITYVIVAFVITSIGYAFVTLMLGALPSGDITSTLQSVYQYLNSFDIFSNWMNNFFSADKLVTLASNFAELLINLLLGIVASIYLLKDKEFFLMIWNKLLSIIFSQKVHGIISEISHEINTVIITFLKGALVDSIIVALLSSIVLSILNIKYAPIIGIIGGILNIIPYFGPFFSMVPAFLVALSNQGIVKGIVAVVALFLVQQLDSNYIYPKIVGTTTGLHPLYVLLSVSIMGYFAGIIGMLIAVPIAGILQVLIKRWAYSK